MSKQRYQMINQHGYHGLGAGAGAGAGSRNVGDDTPDNGMAPDELLRALVENYFNHKKDDTHKKNNTPFRRQVKQQYQAFYNTMSKIVNDTGLEGLVTKINNEIKKLSQEGGYIHRIQKDLLEAIKDQAVEHIKTNILSYSKYEHEMRCRERDKELVDNYSAQSTDEETEGMSHGEKIYYTSVEYASSDDSSISGSENDESDNSISGSENDEGDSSISGSENDESDNSITGSNEPIKKAPRRIKIGNLNEPQMIKELRDWINEEADSIRDDSDEQYDSDLESPYEYENTQAEMSHDAESYREWAENELSCLGDLENPQDVLRQFFSDGEEGYSWFIHSVLMDNFLFGDSLLEIMKFPDGWGREETATIFSGIDMYINWEVAKVDDPQYIQKVMSDAFEEFKNGYLFSGDRNKIEKGMKDELTFYDKYAKPKYSKHEEVAANPRR